MTADQRLRAQASRQDGVISIAELRRVGLTDRQIEHRVGSGELLLCHRGVYIAAGATLTFRARVRAALLACGPDAFASHMTAAVLWNIRRHEPAVIDVTIIGDRHLERAGVRVHRITSGPPPAVRVRDGLRLSAPPRTICELAATESRETVDYAIQEAAARRLLTPRELTAATEAWGSRRGAAILRSILELKIEGELPRSWAERRLATIIARAGLLRPVTNVYVLGHLVDAVWPEQRLIVEVDGIGTHGTPVAFHADRAMDAELTVAGWRVLRFTRRQLKEQPLLVAAQLAAALSQAV